MNLDQLIKKTEDCKKRLYEKLDFISINIKRVEAALKGLPLPDFVYPVKIESIIGEVEEIGHLFMENDRLYFSCKIKKNSGEIVRRPLIEFPVNVRLQCKVFIVPFFQAILSKMGVE